MKTKALAVLLAVCMIASSCVLFASAADIASGSYVKLKSGTNKTADNLTSATSGTDYNIEVTVTSNSDVSMDQSRKGQKVTADDVDKLFTFKQGTKTLTFKSDLASYFDISGDVNDSTTVKFTNKAANTLTTVFEVKSTITDEEITNKADVSEKLSGADKYVLKGLDTVDSKNASVSKWEQKLCQLTLGLRFYGDNTYKNLNADELAIIKAQVIRGSADEKGYTTYANTIYDLSGTDSVYLTTYLKDKNEAKFYAFYGWVTSDGTILYKASDCDTFTGPDSIVQYSKKFPASSGAIYAAYVEIADRVIVTYSCEGEGDFRAFSDDREIAKIGGGEKNMISAMVGRDVTFTFVPKENWEVGKVIVDGKNITSFASIDFSDASNLVKTIRAIIDATYKDTVGGQQESGKYTFENISMNHDIKVVFVKSVILEAPSGKDLPTVEAEGITLATGAADAAANGAANAADGGTTVPAEDGAAANGASAIGGVVNPATGSTGAIAVFAVLSVAAAAAFVTAKKKED